MPSTGTGLMNIHIKWIVVQLLSCVWFFATLWTEAHQAFLSFTISQSLFKLMSIESVMSSNYLILYCLLLLSSIFPSIRVFCNESALRIRWQSIGASALAPVLPMNIQDWFPLRLTGLSSLLSKRLKSLIQQHNSKASIFQHSAFFMVQLS